jgi:sporulation protein YlmC with PRC-barrel domain
MNTTLHPNVLSATTIIGDAVQNPAGEEVGTIKEIMLDTNNGRIMYAVMSVGGFLGLGDQLFAVPWDALTLDASNHCFILDADKELLKQAEGFDKDNWPDFAESQFHTGTYAHYQIEPYWLARARDRSVTAP